jgi:hypothetical protein
VSVKNWRATFLQLCIDHNTAAEFTPTECRHMEELYAILRCDGKEAAERYAVAAEGRCLALWQEYQEAMK